jgi:hypothetical protein
MKYGHRLRAFYEVFGAADQVGPDGTAPDARERPAPGTAPKSRTSDWHRQVEPEVVCDVAENAGRDSSAGYETSASSGAGGGRGSSQRSLSPVPAEDTTPEADPLPDAAVMGPRAPASQLPDLRSELGDRYRALYAMYKAGKAAVRCIRATMDEHAPRAHHRTSVPPEALGRRSRYLKLLGNNLQLSRIPSDLEQVFDAVWVFFDSIIREIGAFRRVFEERTADLQCRLDVLRQQGASSSVRGALKLGAEAEQVLVCLQIAQVAIGKILKKFTKALALIASDEAAARGWHGWDVADVREDALEGAGQSESEQSSTTTTSATPAGSGGRSDANGVDKRRGGAHGVGNAAPNAIQDAKLERAVRLAMCGSLSAALALDPSEEAPPLVLVTRLRRFLVQQPFVCDQRRLGFLADLRHRKDCAVLALHRILESLTPAATGDDAALGGAPTGQLHTAAACAPGRGVDGDQRTLGALTLLRHVLDDVPPPGEYSLHAPSAHLPALPPGGRVRPFAEECRLLARQLESQLAAYSPTTDPSSPYEVATRFYLANVAASGPAVTAEAFLRAARSVPMHFLCPICLDMLFETVELPCRHRFCEVCIQEARFSAELQGATLSCPLCQPGLYRRHCCETADTSAVQAARHASASPEECVSSAERDALSPADACARTEQRERRASSIDGLLRAAFPAQWRLRERQARATREMLERRRRFRERVAHLDAAKLRSSGNLESVARKRFHWVCQCFGDRSGRARPVATPPPSAGDAVADVEPAADGRRAGLVDARAGVLGDPKPDAAAQTQGKPATSVPQNRARSACSIA